MVIHHASLLSLSTGHISLETKKYNHQGGSWAALIFIPLSNITNPDQPSALPKNLLALKFRIIGAIMFWKLDRLHD
jgi:hypothetical protein